MTEANDDNPEDPADPTVGRPGVLGTLVRCCGALAATPGRLLRPRRPDHRLLASLTPLPPPPAQTTVALRALPQSRTSAPLTIVAEGVRSLRTVYTVYGGFLVEHPKARFLIDPGLCANVHERVMPGHPFPVGLLVSPDKPVLGLADALADAKAEVADIDFALATHLHWDHVSGLLELPESVELQVTATEYDWAMTGRQAPYGVVRSTLYDRKISPLTLDGPPVLTFGASHDLFGDGSVLLVDLAGHTPGSIGVLLAVDDGTRVLLAGDAVWNSLQIRLIREKAPMPGKLFDADRDRTFETIHRLHALPSGIEVIASHDYDAMLARA
ncbi:MBL fold metallo-hydrolase [Nocardia sp. alder85J]|uniref:MBL fold metallo-hydrolase n=1 Tax=Nocardia sp. alder85J TaxID=2862949 RepID=UPI001CD4D1BE|nr:MBL fold metallo-hydrolase [Nocardia sp. alder85J]MCX4096424.1 MBL fold metallo-hydrolase [Nocardia sp. alder85J]